MLLVDVVTRLLVITLESILIISEEVCYTTTICHASSSLTDVLSVESLWCSVFCCA